MKPKYTAHAQSTVVGTWTPEHEKRLQMVMWRIAKRIARERKSNVVNNTTPPN